MLMFPHESFSRAVQGVKVNGPQAVEMKESLWYMALQIVNVVCFFGLTLVHENRGCGKCLIKKPVNKDVSEGDEEEKVRFKELEE